MSTTKGATIAPVGQSSMQRTHDPQVFFNGGYHLSQQHPGAMGRGEDVGALAEPAQSRPGRRRAVQHGTVVHVPPGGYWRFQLLFQTSDKGLHPPFHGAVIVLDPGVASDISGAGASFFFVFRVQVTQAQADDGAGTRKQFLRVRTASDSGLGEPGQTVHLPGFDPAQGSVPVSGENLGGGDAHQVEAALDGVAADVGFKVLHGLW